MYTDLLDQGEVVDHAHASLKEAAFGHEKASRDSVVISGEVIGCHFV